MPEGSGRTPIVFVSDASAEAVRIADTLRAVGYAVVDVPLAMLIARVSVQRPHVILLDVDAPGALDEVARLRKLPGSGAVDFLYVGAGEGPIRTADDALSNEGSAFFLRPVDVGGLIRKVEALTGGPAARHEIRPSTPPPSIPPASRNPPPSVPSDRASSPSLPAPGLRTPGPPLPMSTPSLVDLVDPPRSLASFGTVSSELEQLLAAAEMRADASSVADGALPSPDEEIEAVLPADVLASLDEPLDVGADDEGGGDAGARTGAGGEREGTGAQAKVTTSGGTRQTTGAGRSVTPHTQERRTGASEPPRTLEAIRAASRIESVRPGPLSAIGPSNDATPGSVPPGVPLPVPVDFLAPSLPPPPPLISITSAPIALLEPGDGRKFLADAVVRRTTGAVSFEHEGVTRRVVLREGDFVTAASDVERETLVHFLGARGELPRDEVERLAGKVPPFGRHAGAALVAHGWLRQDQLWSVLRAHAEWIAGAIVRLSFGKAYVEADLSARLRGEPSVFGASTGCEIFVELVRRAVSREEALEALGGEPSRLADGPHVGLLAECALPPHEIELLSRARGGTIGDMLTRATDAEIVSVVHALALLGVVEVVPSPDFARGRAEAHASEAGVLLDEEAVRARIRARLELVDEGDYFAVLGVPRDATGYDVRRAFLELRRTFEPSRILTPRLVDLADDVRKIVVVLEEAYEILRDGGRRERYRRAIEARPE